MSDALVLRVDANIAMGTGHLVRSLSLATAWREQGGEARFAIQAATPSSLARIEAEGFDLTRIDAPGGSRADAEQTAALAEKRRADWVVVDGYHFGAEYQESLVSRGLHVLFVDDYGHAAEYASHLVLNQNVGADPALYASRAPHCRLLLGSRYALLGPRFVERIGFRRTVRPTARRLLVTLGGSDLPGATLRSIEALSHLSHLDLETVIAVGGSNPHSAAIEAAAARIDPSPAIHIDTLEMPELMANADIALAAGGTTSWELSFMGLPQLLLVLAPNQRAVAAQLEQLGAAVNLGEVEACPPERIARAIDALLDDPERRADMAARGQALVDGHGAERVVAALRRIPLRLRDATPEDSERIFEWANDRVARGASFQSDPIPWERHREWFERKLADSTCHLLVGEDTDECPVGQVRFELEAGNATVSVSTGPDFRGQGFGLELVCSGVEEMSRRTTVERFTAHVKPGNEASLRLFEAAGFTRGAEQSFGGKRAITFARLAVPAMGSARRSPGDASTGG